MLQYCGRYKRSSDQYINTLEGCGFPDQIGLPKTFFFFWPRSHIDYCAGSRQVLVSLTSAPRFDTGLLCQLFLSRF